MKEKKCINALAPFRLTKKMLIALAHKKKLTAHLITFIRTKETKNFF